MKLLSYFSLASLFASVLAQNSQPECREWTQTQLFDPNPHLQPAEDEYAAQLAGTIHANCLDRDGNLDSCDIVLGEGNARTNYSNECEKNGGVMWQYDYSPECGNSNVKQWIKRVYVCASPDCINIGVQNLIPNPGFMDHLIAAGHSCGVGTMNLKEVPGSRSGSDSTRMVSYGIVALVTTTGYLVM